MKTLAHWSKALLISITLAGTSSFAFPSFLTEPNGFLQMLTSPHSLKILDVKKKFPYVLEENRIVIDVSNTEGFCSYGRTIITVEQSQINGTLQDTIHIEDCENYEGAFIITRKGTDLKPANKKDLLHFRFPPITTETYYEVQVPRNNVRYVYQKNEANKIKLTFDLEYSEGDPVFFIDYTENKYQDETLRVYKLTVAGYSTFTFTARKTKRPEYYELNLYTKEDQPLGIQDFYNSFNSMFNLSFKNILDMTMSDASQDTVLIIKDSMSAYEGL